MYSTLSGFSDEATGQPLGDPKSLLNAMEGLFKAYNVDLFVVGHVHVLFCNLIYLKARRLMNACIPRLTEQEQVKATRILQVQCTL